MFYSDALAFPIQDLTFREAHLSRESPITPLLYSWNLLYTLHCNQLQIKAELLLNVGMHQFAVR